LDLIIISAGCAILPRRQDFVNSRRQSDDRDASDAALVAAMELRDADALGRLYDRHAARLSGLAWKILGETGEAEEVVQEVFLYAWRAAASFDPSRGSVLAWLLVATRSRAIDRLRMRRPVAAAERGGRDPLDDLPASEDIEQGSASREWETLCRAAIGELPQEQRRVLELAYFEGLTHQEIARRTGTALGTVKTRIRLGLMKLRERMRPYWTRERNA
jgi:RNA polymerase sigma-70 factor, ECF subfamily